MYNSIPQIKMFSFIWSKTGISSVASLNILCTQAQRSHTTLKITINLITMLQTGKNGPVFWPSLRSLKF